MQNINININSYIKINIISINLNVNNHINIHISNHINITNNTNINININIHIHIYINNSPGLWPTACQIPDIMALIALYSPIALLHSCGMLGVLFPLSTFHLPL